MATDIEMRRAAERRASILARMRQGLENDHAIPSVTELAEAEGVSRRQIAWDLDLLESEGLIEQDLTMRPRRVKLVGYRVRVEAEQGATS